MPIAPGYQSDGYEKQPHVLGDLLLIPDGDKSTLVFDLAHARALPFIATGYGPVHFQQFGNLLFVLGPRSLAIFDLATSRGVTRFHLVASDFEVDGNRMTLYAGERLDSRAITFTMNLPRIRSHETLVQTLLAADVRARDALARRGSVYAALDAMDDLLETQALSDLSKLVIRACSRWWRWTTRPGWRSRWPEMRGASRSWSGCMPPMRAMR